MKSTVQFGETPALSPATQSRSTAPPQKRPIRRNPTRLECPIRRNPGQPPFRRRCEKADCPSAFASHVHPTTTPTPNVQFGETPAVSPAKYPTAQFGETRDSHLFAHYAKRLTVPALSPATYTPTTPTPNAQFGETPAVSPATPPPSKHHRVHPAPRTV